MRYNRITTHRRREVTVAQIDPDDCFYVRIGTECAHASFPDYRTCYERLDRETDAERDARDARRAARRA